MIAVLKRRWRRALPLAPLIALVGCDGSGKSTLAADLLAYLSARRSIEVCYLGLGSAAIGNRIKRLPFIGVSFERSLVKKAKQTRSTKARIPGLATALVVFIFSLVRVKRFKRVLALRRLGVSIITDRYPQAEIAGFYDGPGLSAARTDNPLIKWLVAYERRLYEWMASYQPNVVIRLNLDAATAYARKPDHAPDLLKEKVRVTPLLRFNGAHIIDVDAHAPYEEVRRRVLEIADSILDSIA